MCGRCWLQATTSEFGRCWLPRSCGWWTLYPAFICQCKYFHPPRPLGLRACTSSVVLLNPKSQSLGLPFPTGLGRSVAGGLELLAPPLWVSLGRLFGISANRFRDAFQDQKSAPTCPKMIPTCFQETSQTFPRAPKIPRSCKSAPRAKRP